MTAAEAAVLLRTTAATGQQGATHLRDQTRQCDDHRLTCVFLQNDVRHEILYISLATNDFYKLVSLRFAAHLHHAGVHVHLVQRERLLCLVGSDLPTQGLHVTVELPLEALEGRLFDVVHQYVVLGFNLQVGKKVQTFVFV